MRITLERLSSQIFQLLMMKSGLDARLRCNCENKISKVKTLEASLIAARGAVFALAFKRLQQPTCTTRMQCNSVRYTSSKVILP